jgi:hypothetical protein
MSEPIRRVVIENPKATQTLFEALKEHSRGQPALVRMTRADAVTWTGLPTAQVEPALKSLLRTYRSHLSVTEDGDLVYAFDPTFERRDRVTLREKMKDVSLVAYKGFKFLFKIWIVVTLVVYVLAFLAMLMALVVVRQGSDERDERRGSGFGSPWLWYWLLPDWGVSHDQYAYAPRRQLGRPKKKFYQAVFDYVFGPSEAPVDPRESDKRFLSYLRDRAGRVTASDVVALFGLSYQEAEEELTRLLAEYDGDVEVAEDGTLIYAFTELLKSSEERSSPWRYEWEQSFIVPALTGNTAGVNAAITGFTAFNLVAANTIGPAFLERFQLMSDGAQFLVSGFPLIFSALFFAVPGARAIARSRRQKRANAKKLRAALLKAIYTAGHHQIDPDATVADVGRALGLAPALVRTRLDELHRDLDGDVMTRDDGKVLYAFPRLDEEQTAVKTARALQPVERLGQVIFSSEDANEAPLEPSMLPPSRH